MSLVAKIDADLKAAMIARDAEKLSVLRMLKSAVKYASIEKGGADSVPSDIDVIAVVRKEAKKREDSIKSNSPTVATRPELAAKEKKELDFLKTMLPAQMTPEKMEELVKEAIAEVGATSKAQMGSVMKAAQAKAAGQADGKTLSQIVQRSFCRSRNRSGDARDERIPFHPRARISGALTPASVRRIAADDRERDAARHLRRHEPASYFTLTHAAGRERPALRRRVADPPVNLFERHAGVPMTASCFR